MMEAALLVSFHIHKENSKTFGHFDSDTRLLHGLLSFGIRAFGSLETNKRVTRNWQEKTIVRWWYRKEVPIVVMREGMKFKVD